MAQRPSHPQAGQQLSARWGRQLLDWIETVRPKGDHATTKVSPEGYISAFTGEAGGDTYNGQFKVTDGTEEDTVDISAGKVISGTSVKSVEEEEAVASIGALYVYLEVWYDGGWQVMHYADSSYPTQAKFGSFFVWRVLLASREEVNGAWVRQVCGELHNPRAVPA